MLLGCSQSPSIAPCHFKEPTPYISLLFLCFCSGGSNQHKTWAAGGISVFIWEAGWKSHLGTILLSAVSEFWIFCMIIRSLLPMSIETTHDPKKPVLLILQDHAAC